MRFNALSASLPISPWWHHWFLFGTSFRCIVLTEQTSFHAGGTGSARCVNIFRDFPHCVKTAVMEASLAERSPPLNDLLFTFPSQ